MNTRIRELMAQAMVSTGVEGLGGEYRELNPEKFAELIVRECCSIGEQYADGLFDLKHYAFVNKRIRKNFGVEE